MKIFVKQSFNPRLNNNLTAKPAEIKELKYKISAEKSNLAGKRIQDPVQALKNLKMWEKTLDNVRPRPYTMEERNQMWKRAKALKDEFTEGMLSSDELHPVRQISGEKGIQVVVDDSKMGNNRFIERQVKWIERNNDKVAEFKNIMRNLNPDNPQAGDIERFRPARSSK